MSTFGELGQGNWCSDQATLCITETSRIDSRQAQETFLQRVGTNSETHATSYSLGKVKVKCTLVQAVRPIGGVEV